MKKTLPLLAFSLLVLAGCKDAYTNITNNKEALVTIGDTDINSEDVYKTLLSTVGSSYTISDVTTKILDAEIEISEEMRKEAQEQLDFYKAQYETEEDFKEFMSFFAIENEEDFLKSLTNTTRSNELTKKYILENFEELVKEFNPKKAIIMSFTDADSANAALVELKNGTDPSEVATAYGSVNSSPEIVTTQSTYSSEVMSIVNTMSKDEDFSVIPSTDGTTTYIIKVLETDPNLIQDEVSDTLASFTDIQNKTLTYYLNKYKFTIYDKALFDDMVKNYPDYVVQGK